MKNLRVWVKFTLLVLAVIAILAWRGRVVLPPEPPRPEAFTPEYPGPELDSLKLKEAVTASFEPVVFGIVDDPVVAARGVLKFSQTIRAAAKKYRISQGTLEGIIYLESQGDPMRVSPAGCAGIAQFAPGTARGTGLVVSNRWQDLLLAYRLERRPVRKARKLAKLQRFDQRFAPHLAISAMARHLADLRDSFGGEDYAIAAYHMGGPNLRATIRKFKSGWKAPDGLNWMDIVLEAGPDSHPKTFNWLHHRLRDDSVTYYFRVLAAKEAMRLWRADRREFLEKVNFYQEAKSRGRRPRLAVELAWYDRDDFAVSDLTPIQAGPLFNLEIDEDVSSPEARPAMVGFLVYLASRVRESGGGQIRVTSAYRTEELQRQLVLQGRSPSLFTTHRAGMGVDLGRCQGRTRDALEWELGLLRYVGDLEWYREGNHYHITLNPVRDYFEKIIADDLPKYQSQLETYEKWQKIKPVGFWEGFWGRLFSPLWLVILAGGILFLVRLDRRR